MKSGIGQDSHAFLAEKGEKCCIIAGVHFDDVPGWDADSDGDIAYHAICNAITSITHVPILGGIAIKMCHEQKITDSREYLLEALKTLGNVQVVHLALTIEARRPRMQKKIDEMRQNIAEVMRLEMTQVGITCTSGDGLTAFGRGEGGQCFCIITVN